ncbi:MAG: hypothetical protein M0Q48_08140 [Verrucomicrobia bacterium]|nr:hypothetical protein [Verrucomicrobiota bacterium]
MNTYNKKMLAVVFSAFCIWGIAQTSQSADQKAEAESATNNGVTITQGPGASTPEGTEPQGGWFTPLYRAEGMIKGIRVNSKTAKVKESEYPFTISLDGKGRWQMSFVSTSIITTGEEGKLNSTMYLSYDGTNILSTLESDGYVDMDENGKVMIKRRTDGDNRGRTATISPGPFPSDFGILEGFVWVAFVSGEHLPPQQSVARIPNLLDSARRFSPSVWSVDFHYNILTDSLIKLIDKGYFILNTNYISDDLTDYNEVFEPEGETIANELKNNFDSLKDVKENEFLRSFYILDEIMEFEEIKIPIRFSSTIYPNIGYGSTADPYKMNGVVTNIILNPSVVSMLPPVKGIIYVQDTRFLHRTKDVFRGMIFYSCTNEWEIATNSAKLIRAGSTALHPRMLPQAPVANDSSSKRKWVLLAILILPIPFLCIWYYRVRKES